MEQEVQKIWSLYRILNKINGKLYIGQAVDVQHRWADHRRAVRLNKPTQAVHHAMIKYGLDNFEFEIIASCISQEAANETETVLVKQYNSFIKYGKGYNATLGGMNAPKSEEWKAAMSAIKGGWIDREHTQENLEKNRQRNLGSTHSEETVKKRSSTMKEKCANGWMPVNIYKPGDERAAVWKGKKHSEETKRKVSEALKGIPKHQSFTRYLTSNKVILIRELYKSGTTDKELSKQFEVSVRAIRYIVNGKTWKHLLPSHQQTCELFQPDRSASLS